MRGLLAGFTPAAHPGAGLQGFAGAIDAGASRDAGDTAGASPFTAGWILSGSAGGTFWNHTLVVLGSEFGRTAGGNRFNSARGSDHGGDLATRWMSMPVMGGLVTNSGIGGRTFGYCRRADLVAEGDVYSYRSLMKLLLDLLGCDHAEFFPADAPITDLFG